MVKQVSGIISAQEIQKPEWAKGPGRSKAKRDGKRYENRVAKMLPQGWHGKWFRYCDENGSGCCSPDIILGLGSDLVVLEVKLTFTKEAELQLRGLYFPVLLKLYGCKVWGIIVCKNLVPGISNPIVWSLREATDLALKGQIPVLHWLGKGPL